MSNISEDTKAAMKLIASFGGEPHGDWTDDEVRDFSLRLVSAVNVDTAALKGAQGGNLSLEALPRWLDNYRTYRNAAAMLMLSVATAHIARYGHKFGPTRLNALDWNQKKRGSKNPLGFFNEGKCPAQAYHVACLPVATTHWERPEFDNQDRITLRLHPREQFLLRAHRAIEAYTHKPVSKVRGGFHLFYKGAWISQGRHERLLHNSPSWELEGIIGQQHLFALANQCNKVRNFALEAQTTSQYDFRTTTRQRYEMLRDLRSVHTHINFMLHELLTAVAQKFYGDIDIAERVAMEPHAFEMAPISDDLEFYYGPSPYLNIDVTQTSKDVLDVTDIGAAAVLPNLVFSVAQHASQPNGEPVDNGHNIRRAMHGL